MFKKISLITCIFSGIFLTSNVFAQCSAEQEEANKAVVALFPFGAPISELLHEEYTQHNPAF